MGQNTTDYDFPDGWGLFSDEQKDTWFKRERVFRQARRQDTAFGNAYQQHKNEQDRLDTDDFRIN